MPLKSIIFIMGTTAIGKTRLSIKLAKKIHGEIVSCDSMQVYKGMDIGTQKPSLELRKKVKHHMVDILTPDEEFSAADFRKRALRIIREVHKRDKVPLFVGGTGLYMKALVDGLFPSPPKDEGLRKKLYRQTDRYGAKYIHEKLKKIDPETAGKIHPNDAKKTIRALEIYYTTKKKPSEMKANTRPLTERLDVKIFGLIRPREELYRRINERVEKMFDEGFLDEAKRLAKKKLSITAAQAIGYKEAIGYLKDNANKDKKGSIRINKGEIRDDRGVERIEEIGEIKEIEELKELIKKNTRRYAKRQLTWFRADKRIEWFDASRMRESDIVDAIYRDIKGR